MVALGLGLYGFGTGTWDVAMNVEGADVERRLGRTVMPRFHAGYSFGAIGGAGVGVLAARFSVPIPVHLMLVALAALAAVLASVRAFTPVAAPDDSEDAESGRSAWLEPRTIAIGAMVLAFTLAEGSAGDWLALALVDGYDARHFVGRGRVRAVRHRDDHRPDGRPGPARPLRAGAGPARLCGGRVRRAC